ncbi:kynureninase 2 [Podospora didyma]|uniref:Kynureninase n=1 Tax=Podospora didyma TaxID=330526 RepID=A0AAE0KDC3_9PEZI|nr:kynureninase 2 [Podospora didyma]
MEFDAHVHTLRAGMTVEFPAEAATLEYAQQLDKNDKLSHLRDQFLLPSRLSLKKKALDGTIPGTPSTDVTSNPGPQPNGAKAAEDDTSSIYFVGNSLGAQPKAVRRHLNAQLETWASIGVNGHFTTLQDSPLASWQDMAEDCARKFVPIVGAASPSEVVVMNTLTANLHLMMASFYRPTEKRHKIILEWKPFPSDWYAIQSQIEWHSLSPQTSMVEIQPDANLYLSTERILAAIDEHADSTALLLLPGIQYYTGQLLDMKRITAHARGRGIPAVGWDLAHAAGNVELCLHDWDVDFAVWCTYKYLNAGPGSIAGAFVHSKHSGTVEGTLSGYRHRLAGWYGADKSVRFNMAKEFQPTPGAPGFQLSNPSSIDLASLTAALEVFGMTRMTDLRSKALLITAYAELLLDRVLLDRDGQIGEEEAVFKIITPRNPLERGSQLSLLLKPGLLDRVSQALVENGVVFDARKPDVIRVAPVPMYCTFVDVWNFVEIFKRAIDYD